MKAKKLLALLLAVVFVVTQFAMLGSVSAATALTGRNDFALGVNIHSNAGFSAYTKTAQVISDASALGSNIVRTDIVSGNMAYNVAVADMAAKKGMQVMAIAKFDYLDSEKALIAAADIDVAGITSRFTEMATALKGKVAYYQINNEMCNELKKDDLFSDSTSADGFNDVSGVAAGLNAAYDAIKAADPDAKVVVNFCWTHYGFLKALKAAGAKWDVTGFDWYYSNEKADTYYETVITNVVTAFEKPVIICESNVKPTGYDSNGKVEYNKDASWLGNFVTSCYNNDDVIGFIAYELYDQPAFETEGFNEQSHFGLIDKDGNKKDTYNTLLALYGGTGVDSWRSPAIAASDDQFVIKEGEALASVYSTKAITGQGHLPGYSPAEVIFENPGLSKYSFIEFDYYVENLANFTARNTKLYLNLRENNTSRGTVEFTSQLTKNGWNHVKVDVSGLGADALNAVIKARFYIDIDASEVGATDPYIISNIIATKDLENIIPDMPDSKGMFVLVEGLKFQGTYGSAAVTGQGHLPGGAANLNFTNPGLANYDYFEFDYYVADLANLTARNTKLYYNLRKTPSTSHFLGDFTAQLTENGWNHVKIALTDSGLDADTLNIIDWIRFYIDIDASEAGATDAYKIANVCFTKDQNDLPPEMTESKGMFILAEGTKFEGAYGSAAVTGQGHLPGGAANLNFTNPGLANFDYFEFDYYVENLANLTARNTKLYYNLRKVNGNPQSHFLGEFTAQLTENGWNHVKIALTDSGLDADTLNIIDWIRFYIDIDASEAGATDAYKIANVCFTKDQTNLIPDMPNSIGMFALAEGLKFEGAYGSAAVTGQGHLPGGAANLNFTNPGLANFDYFEFDYYVADLANLTARNTKLYYNLRKVPSTSKFLGEFTAQLTENGWNHVKIALTDSGLDADTLNSIDWIRFYIDIDASEVGATDAYKIANVCFTSDQANVVPDMPDSKGMFVLAEGLKFEGAYGSAAITQQGHLPGYSPAEVIFENPGLVDYTNFEFDYYVANWSNFTSRGTKLYLNLRAADNKSKALIDFTAQLTQSGWNHVVISIADLELDEETLNGIAKARYYIDINAGETGAADVFKIANMCITSDKANLAPDMPESDGLFVIGQGIKLEGVYGSAAITDQGHLPGYSPAEVVFVNPGLANHDFIEFDYYVENLANLTARNIKLYLNLREDQASKAIFEFQDQLTADGWNHVVIAISDLDNEIRNSIIKTRFYIDIDASEVGATDAYMVANICATKAEDNTAPDMPDSEGIFKIYTGIAIKGELTADQISGQGHLPGYGANGQNPAEVTFENPRLANYGFIEFDYYAEVQDNLVARNTKLYLNVRNAASQSRGIIEFQDQILVNGWNHVKIAIEDLDIDADTLNSIARFRFYIDIDAGGLGNGDPYKIANICVTKDPNNIVPDMAQSTGMFIIHEGLKLEGVYGNAAITEQGHLPGFNPAEAQFTNPGLAKYSYIEFDYYVADFDNFSARNTKLYLNLRAADNKSKALYNFTEQLTQTGWNHVKVVITDLDAETLNSITKARFYIDIDAGETGATDAFKIANICAIRELNIAAPEMPVYDDMFVIGEGIKIEGVLGSAGVSGQGHLPGYGIGGQNPAELMFENPELAAYNTIEFDIYVDEINSLTARNTKLYLNLRNAAVSVGTIEFQDQLTQNGWNHVKVVLADADLDADTLNSVVKARFYIDIDASEVGANDLYKIANVIAAKDAANMIPEINNTYKTMDSILGAQHTLELAPGENPVDSGKHSFVLSKALDTLRAQYIEMDIYVSADVDAGATFWVSEDAENAANRGSYTLPNDLKEGWNHVVISLADIVSAEGDFNFKGYNFVAPYIEGAFFSADHATGGKVVIANLSVTYDITAPSDVMAEKENFIEDLLFTSFDADGMYMIDFDAKDISNADMIELDVYVSDDAIDAIGIDIMDAEGNYAAYDFEGLTNGWNHLAVRLCDLVPAEENAGELDLTTISYFTLWGVEEAEFVVANAYAASYVEGDANRDGVLDLRDVVRAKKIVTGDATEGNKLAVSGADYAIDSADLVTLAQIVLKALFG